MVIIKDLKYLKSGMRSTVPVDHLDLVSKNIG